MQFNPEEKGRDWALGAVQRPDYYQPYFIA
jgi:hypothetical protein